MRNHPLSDKTAEVLSGLLLHGTIIAVRDGKLEVRSTPSMEPLPRSLGAAASKLKLALVAELGVECSMCGGVQYVEHGLNYVMTSCGRCASTTLRAKYANKSMGYWSAHTRKANDFCGTCGVIAETFGGTCVVCLEKDPTQFDDAEGLDLGPTEAE